MQIIIPMSGIGKRFIEEGYNDPKPLIEVDRKPIIEHVVNLFPGEKNISFICNDKHLKETNMREVIGRFCPYGKIYEVPVEGRKGPVHAVSLIFDNINDDEEIIVSYCDYGTYWDYEKFLRDTRERNADGAIACYRGFHPHMLGTDNYAFLKETKKDSRWMEAIQEKQPFTNNRMNEYASNGTYYFKSGAIMKKYFQKLMDLEMKVNNEYYVSMVYNLLVKDDLKVNIFEIEHMLQWGTPYDLEIYKNWSRYFTNILKEQPIYIDKYDTTTIMPLAGKGSRFTKLYYKDPKPLLDINNLPMVVQAIKCLPQSTNNIFICLEEHLNNYKLEEKLRETYPESKIYAINKVTEGQACTTEIGINNANLDLEKPILITACDNGVYYDVEKYKELVEDENNDVILWSFRNEPTSKNNPNMYAWVDADENDIVKSVSCKKFIEGIHDIKKSHVIIGTMFFRKSKYFMNGLQQNYKENIRSNNEFYVDDVLNQNIKSGLQVKVFQVENYICWGTPDDYETYLYWQQFFDKCNWHPYKKEEDRTFCIKNKKFYTIRENCIFCLNKLTKEYFEYDYKIPIACYSKENKSDDIFIPYNIYICDKCKTIQTKYLGDLNEVYKINHADSTGSIMQNLHKTVLNFIQKYSDRIKNIMEIGSSLGILSDLVLDNNLVEKYYIVEPSYYGKYRKNKIIIHDFFENIDLTRYNNYNTILISHVYEHFYDPLNILKIISSCKNIEYFILIWPDLEYYKDNNVYHVLNTEHTYYVDNNFIISLFNNYQFELKEKFYYKNHSVIFIFEKNINLNTLLLINKNYFIDDFFNNLLSNKYKIIEFKKKYKNKKLCIWPASVHTQFLIMIINENNIFDYVLDNSPNKINKYLYGFNLKCLPFNDYINNNDYALILNGGIFNNEVVNCINISYLVI